MAGSNERQVQAPSGRVWRGCGVNVSLKLAFSQNVLPSSVPIRSPLQLQVKNVAQRAREEDTVGESLGTRLA